MPKNSIKFKPTSPSKDDANGAEADKNKKEMDEFRKGIREEIIASVVKLKEERRAPEDAVFKELKEEMSKVVISGYSFSEADNDVVNELVYNKLTRLKGLEVAAVDKKNVVMNCPSTEVALVVAALLRDEILDSRVAGY